MNENLGRRGTPILFYLWDLWYFVSGLCLLGPTDSNTKSYKPYFAATHLSWDSEIHAGTRIMLKPPWRGGDHDPGAQAGIGGLREYDIGKLRVVHGGGGHGCVFWSGEKTRTKYWGPLDRGELGCQPHTVKGWVTRVFWVPVSHRLSDWIGGREKGKRKSLPCEENAGFCDD